MKESEVEQTLSQYGESLGRFTRKTQPSRFKKVTLALAPLAVAGVCAIAFVAWPRNASAAALERLKQALTNAKSMDSLMSYQEPSGKWVPLSRVSLEADRWRMQGMSKQMPCTIIFRDGLVFVDYSNTAEATVQNAADTREYEKLPSPGDALETVQTILKRQVGEAAELKLGSSPAIAGRPTYKVSFQNRQRHCHGELVVDKESDFPITAEAWYDYPKQHSRWDYHFNVAFPSGFFELTPGRRLVDLRKTIPAREAAWTRPVAASGEVQILDACVTPKGTVWAVTKHKQGSKIDFVPAEFKGVKGAKYFGPIQLTSRPFRGSEFQIVGYMPLYSVAEVPKRCSLTFEWATMPQQVQHSDAVTPGRLIKMIGPISIPLRREPAEIPAYFADLGMEVELIHLPFDRDWRRADTLQKLGRFAEAAAIYYQIAQQSTSQFGGFYSWRETAAKCYAKAGDKAAVKRIEKELADARRENGGVKP